MKRLLILACSLAIGLSAGAYARRAIAQERIVLATPEPAPSNLRYQVDRLAMQFDNPDTPADEGILQIFLMGVERPLAVACVYDATTTPTATALLNGLNKANMASAYAANATTGTLRQRIYHRLVVMNEAPAVCGRSLAGALAGVPQ